MSHHAIEPLPEGATLPSDDPARQLTVSGPDDAGAKHIALAGNIYTILVSGAQTDGRYCLIDMLVQDGGGPPPHRHDFEEMFTLLKGELDFTFRGQTSTVAAPATVNIPANAPHAFKNTSGKTVRLLCMCTPAGQEDFFLSVADPVASRTAAPVKLSDEERAARAKKAMALAPRYRTEMLM